MFANLDREVLIQYKEAVYPGSMKYGKPEWKKKVLRINVLEK